MEKNSNIEWTNDTWNPWQGCHKVSPGCKFCYMYRDKKRYGQDPTVIVKSKPATFNAPLTKFKGPLVFTCSWSDFFIDEAFRWVDEAWDVIRRTPHLTYQILTKRPENIKDFLPEDWGDGWPNVWLGVSVETSEQLWRIEALDAVPSIAVQWVSYEPALAPVDFTAYVPVLQWIVSGGESGPDARPARLDWFRDVRDTCQQYGIAYFHKQNGGSRKIDGTWGGALLDGREWKELPQTERVKKIV